MSIKITVVNPNTSEIMTRKIAAEAASAASPESIIRGVDPGNGPLSIEGHCDETVAAAAMIEWLKSDNDNADAYVIACFGDPGLYAARELSSKPVIGIAEAAMHAASFLSGGFSIVTTLARAVPGINRLASEYGFGGQCKSVRATGLAVLDFEDSSGGPYDRLRGECDAALQEDESGVIILGCAGMTDLRERLSQDLGVPVVDGVAAAVKFAEALVSMGLTTSKTHDFAFPPPKTYLGKYSCFTSQAKQ